MHMKINEVIKERRLAKQLTQEQIAKYLGVTTPAVNKWEKGTSYPDITLLPSLARILDTDLNTLLSFKDELTDYEIGLFLNEVAQIMETDGFEKGYTYGMKKLKEYPTCHPLALNIALLLDGGIVLYGAKENAEKYQSTIESLYLRASQSKDNSVRNLAQSKLISRYIEHKEYEKAQDLLNQLPDKTTVDKKQLQVNLFIARGELNAAAKLEEEKLFSAINEIQSILITLMEIAIQENRVEDAEYIANISQKSSKLFDLWEYNSYIAHFHLYELSKKQTQCVKILIPMLNSLTHPWEIDKSPLYQHIKSKHVENEFGIKMRNSLMQLIKEDENFAFLQENKEFQNFINEMKCNFKNNSI